VDNILAVRPPQNYPEPGVLKKQNKSHTLKALVAAMPANAKKTKQTQVSPASPPRAAVRSLPTPPAGAHSLGAGGVQRTRKATAAYDLWDTQDFNVNNQTTLKEQARKPVFTHRTVGVKSLNKVAAVEVDAPGCSFNPPKEAHEEIIAKVRPARPASPANQLHSRSRTLRPLGCVVRFRKLSVVRRVGQAVAVEVEKDLQRELKPTVMSLAASTIQELIAEELMRCAPRQAAHTVAGLSGTAQPGTVLSR
jgi:hypothetical protein